MTPERKAWWDSLLTEEKRVRRDIKELRTQIAWHKIGLNSSCGHETEMRKFALRMNKRIIKALRKEIAQRPVIRTQPLTASPYKCPRCGASLMYLLRCVKCGQKLRWENDRTC